MEVKTNSHAASVLKVRVSPVASLTRLTAAPATGLPVGSSTRPEMVPAELWPKADAAMSRRAEMTANVRFMAEDSCGVNLSIFSDKGKEYLWAGNRRSAKM